MLSFSDSIKDCHKLDNAKLIYAVKKQVVFMKRAKNDFFDEVENDLAKRKEHYTKGFHPPNKVSRNRVF